MVPSGEAGPTEPEPGDPSDAGEGEVSVVGETPGEGEGEGEACAGKQADASIVFVSIVTEALRARARPNSVAELSRVIEAKAINVPRMVDPVPSVAELPICQKMRHVAAAGSGLLMMLTLLAEPVMSVEAVLKIHTASGSFCASRVSVLVISNVPSDEL